MGSLGACVDYQRVPSLRRTRDERSAVSRLSLASLILFPRRRYAIIAAMPAAAAITVTAPPIPTVK